MPNDADREHNQIIVLDDQRSHLNGMVHHLAVTPICLQQLGLGVLFWSISPVLIQCVVRSTMVRDPYCCRWRLMIAQSFTIRCILEKHGTTIMRSSCNAVCNAFIGEITMSWQNNMQWNTTFRRTAGWLMRAQNNYGRFALICVVCVAWRGPYRAVGLLDIENGKANIPSFIIEQWRHCVSRYSIGYGTCDGELL